jgi:hypothetical protein
MYKVPRSSLFGLGYSSAKWAARIIWTLLLPLLLALVVIKGVKQLFTSEDERRAREEAGKRMAILSELSEFEWRNEVTVFFRLTKRAIDRSAITKETPDVLLIEDVLMALLLSRNVFCTMRQETLEEFCKRRIDELLTHDYDKEPILQEKPEQITSITEYMEKEFFLIEKYGRGDVFREFYLGRRFMFLKINRGKPKRNESHEMEPQQS